MSFFVFKFDVLTIIFACIPIGTEENNLVGTLASEIALLPELAVWGMERGGLTGMILKTKLFLSRQIQKFCYLTLNISPLFGSTMIHHGRLYSIRNWRPDQPNLP